MPNTMPMGSTRHRPPSPSAAASETPSSSPTLEQIEGRVESVTDRGLRLSGRWYDWPRGWAGERPAVGQVIRLHYRTRFIMQAIEPVHGSKNQATAPTRQADRPSSAPPSALSSAPPSARRPHDNGEPDRPDAGAPPRTVVQGTIEAANHRGVKLNGIWYNFSRLTPIPDGVRQALVRGATVQLAVENQRWIVEAAVDATDGSDEELDGAYDESYL